MVFLEWHIAQARNPSNDIHASKGALIKHKNRFGFDARMRVMRVDVQKFSNLP